MRITITHELEASSIQKATALRDQCAARLDEDDDTTVIASSLARITQTFTVYGVDTKTAKPFTEYVEAADEQAAREQVATKTKVIALVTG